MYFRSIAYYFPVTLHLCAKTDTRMTLLHLALWRSIVYFSLLVLGVWQVVLLFTHILICLHSL